MKKSALTFLAILFSLMFAVASCKKEDDKQSTPSSYSSIEGESSSFEESESDTSVEASGNTSSSEKEENSSIDSSSGSSEEVESKYTSISKLAASSTPWKGVSAYAEVIAKGESGFMVNDGTGSMYYYTGSLPDVNVGDELEIVGDTALFGYTNTQQFKNGSTTYTVKNLNKIDYQAGLPTDWANNEVENYTGGTGTYVKMTVELFVSGNYYNCNKLSPSATKVVSLVPPTQEVLGNIAIGATPTKVIVTGYVCYASGNSGKYVYILADTIQLAEQKETNNILSIENDFGDSGISSYNTGNYGADTCEGYNFEYYRAYRPKNEEYLMNLLSFDTILQGYDTLPAALYNTEPIFGIDLIEITYQSTEDGYLYTGDDRVNEMTCHTLAGTDKQKRVQINVDSDNFFKIVCGESDLTIIDLDIHYTNVAVSYDSSKFQSGEGAYRKNATVYEGVLQSGVSSVSVPVKIDYIGGEYVTTQTKTYTYYSYQYIVENPQYAEAATMTDPIDVINYYQAFKEFPANYVAKNFSDGKTETKLATAREIFGDDARYVSKYSRTNGYALHVPYSTHNTTTPVYYEFDIALEESYWLSNSRGVGRVVAWEDGWTGSGYDHSVVAIYTDDHYQTFQEYLNTGYFSSRFDAECTLTNKIWSAPTCIE